MSTKKPSKAVATTDTLTIAAGKAGLSKEAFDSVRKWLMTQLMANVNAKLSQGGHKEDNVALRQVFIDLPLKGAEYGGDKEPQYFLAEFLAAEPLPLHLNRFSLHGGEPPGSDEMPMLARRSKAPSNPGFSANILIGGPGQGKSTLGQLACQLHRAALLVPLLAQLSSEAQRDMVRAFALPQKGKDKTLALPKQALLPLQIALPDLSAWLATQRQAGSDQRADTPSLLRFLAAQPGAQQSFLAAETLLALCAQMPVLLVLDGFDEVGATDDRQALVAAGRELLDFLTKQQTGVKIIAATRPQGYGGELAQLGIPVPERVLAPLDLNQAMAYAQKLVSAKVHDPDQQQKLLVRLESAAQDPNTQRLLGTPLQVTIMTALVQQYGRAPKERWQLFDKYYTYTFDREIERNTYASDLLHDHRKRIDKIHARVALLLQVEAERTGGGAARMPRAKLEAVIQTVLQEDEVAEREQAALVVAIAKAAEQRLVFLVEPEPGAFGFEIRSLQEFMAAWALSAGREDALKGRLMQIAAAPMFRNVALFIASRWYSEDADLADLFAQDVCDSLEQAEVGNEAGHVICAGALFALELLEEGVALGQPKRARALMARAIGLLRLPPAHEHVRLARVVNVDTVAVLKEELERQFNDAEANQPLSAWVCVLAGCDRAAPWATQLGEKYWHKLADLGQIIQLLWELKLPLGTWLTRMVAPVVAQIPPQVLAAVFVRETDHWIADFNRFYTDHFFLQYSSNLNYAAIGAPWDFGVQPPPTFTTGPWHAWSLAVQYELAPSATSLAQVLNAVAVALPQENWQALAHRSSWPLAVCLVTARDSADLRRFSEFAQSGILGNTADWLAAQDREPSLAEMRLYFAALPELWTVQSLQITPPLLAISNDFFLGYLGITSLPSLPFLQILAQAFMHCTHAKIKRRLAELCLMCFGFLESGDSIGEFELLSWLNQNTDSVATMVPCPAALPQQDWLRLLAACELPRGESSHFFSAARLIDVLQAAPLHPVALRVASLTIGFAASGSEFGLRASAEENLVNALAQYQANNLVDHTDVFILQIYINALPADRDAGFITALTEIAESTPALWQSAISALQHGQLSAPRASTMLAQIYQHLGPSHEYTDSVIGAIRQRQMSIKSGLEAPQVWQALALPLPAPDPTPRRPATSETGSPLPAHPIHLHSLEVKNLRGLQHLAFQFHCPAPEQGQWVVLLGPNGVGKTTLLRSLAIGLRNVADQGSWPNNAFNPWRRANSTGEAAFVKVGTARHGAHEAALQESQHQFVQSPPQKQGQPLFPLFAYGCRRGSALGGTKSRTITDDRNGEEIATLFDDDADLLQAETWLVSLEGDTGRNPQSKIIYEAVITAIKTLLNVAAVTVENRRVMVTEHDRPRLPLDALSDGYLTSAGWFLDLIARWLDLAIRHQVPIGPDFMQTMRGLVLIDEIDLHLHPQWQIDIIARTRELLPQMSFIVTSHNPLTLVGAQAQEIWILENRQGQIRATQCEETPMLLTGGQLYRRYFGITDIYPNGLGRDMERYTFLASYAPRTDAEQAELERLGEKLRAAQLEPDVEIVAREFLPEATPTPPPAPKKRAPRKPKAEGA